MKIKEVIKGTDGNDILIGEDGSQIIIGADGNDILIGGDGDDKLIGGDGDDELFGNGGDDQLIGGDGDDIGTGGSGSDVYLGGSGNDTGVYDFSVNNGFDYLDYYNGGSNTVDGGDTLELVITDDELLALGIGVGTTDEEKILSAKDQIIFLFNTNVGGLIDFTVLGINLVIRNFENINISSGGADIVGTPGDDVLIGTTGDDTISPIAGNDTVDGGAGFDTLNYANDTNGITTDLAAGTATGTGINTSFVNMEGFVYGSGNDTFINNAAGTHTVNLGAGINTLILRDGGGTTFFEDGGVGSSITLRMESAAPTPTFELDFAAGTYGFNPTAEGTTPILVVELVLIDIGIATTAVKTLPELDAEAAIFGTGTVTFNELTHSVAVSSGSLIVGGPGRGTVDLDGFPTVVLSRFADTININNAAMANFQGKIFDMAEETDLINASLATVNLSYNLTTGALTDTTNTVTINNAENVIMGSGNDNVTGNAFDNMIEGAAGGDMLNGGGGTNTLSYASDIAGVTVLLATNTVAGGHATGDTISNFQNVHGGSGIDILVGTLGVNDIKGGAGDDLIEGGDGADFLDGGDGTADSVAYFNSPSGVTVNLATNTGSGGDAEGDQISGFENIQGSFLADILTGDDGNNTIFGFNGNDTIEGGAGADRLVGGTDPSDTVSYASDTTGVTVNLNTTFPQSSPGDAGGDELLGFENIIGGSGDDTLTGDGNANTIEGGDGNDTIAVQLLNTNTNLNDFYDGGAGIDTLDLSALSLTHDTYTNTTTLTLFSALPGGFFAVDFNDDGVLTGIEREALLTSIENVNGSLGNDIVYVGTEKNEIFGNTGDDTIIVKRLNTEPLDIDTYNGEGGSDTLDTTTISGSVEISLLANTFEVGASLEANIFDIENMISGPGNDTLTGDGNANEIEGGKGNDILDGGAGLDTFIFNITDTGDDILNNFIQTEDQLDFQSYGLTNIGDLNIVLNGGNSEVSVGADLVVTVTGVTGLVDGDFMF